MKASAIEDYFKFGKNYPGIDRAIGFDLRKWSDFIDAATDDDGNVFFGKPVLKEINHMCYYGTILLPNARIRDDFFKVCEMLGFNLVQFKASLNDEHFWQTRYEDEQSPFYKPDNKYCSTIRDWVTFKDRWAIQENGWSMDAPNGRTDHYEPALVLYHPYCRGGYTHYYNTYRAGYFKALEAVVDLKLLIKTPKSVTITDLPKNWANRAR